MVIYKVKDVLILSVGFIVIAAGLALSLIWNSIIEDQINKALILTEGSKSYDAFVNKRIPMLVKFYFWNWTNPSDLKDPDYKPIMEELGPYTYKEVMEIKDLVWNKNGTVSYTRSRSWYHVPEYTNGSLDDLVTSINAVPIAAAHMTRDYDFVSRGTMNAGIQALGQSIHVTYTVGELMFGGYNNPMLDIAKTMGAFQEGNIPKDKFGWMYGRNGSSMFEGIFNVETGTNGMESFGKLRNWNFKNHTSYFPDECGAVRGSAGEFFPPNRTKNDVIEMFSSDFCRHVSFYFTKEVEENGINLYQFETKPTLFDNGENNPENACFCESVCAPSGVVSVSSCRVGAPAYISYPHFYSASPKLRDATVGMKPDIKRHGPSHIVMEPTLGLPFSIAARFQMNMLIQPYSDLTMFDGVQKIYFPVFWMEQTAEIPDDVARTIRILLKLRSPVTGVLVPVLVAALGIGLILWAAFNIWYKKKKMLLKHKNTILTSQEEPML